MEMKKIMMASHSATLPHNIPTSKLHADSIILVDEDGLETVVGSSAFVFNPDGGRIFGGSPTDQHYQRLVRALLAKGLGAGEHEVTIGLSAAQQYVMSFRANKSTTDLNIDATKALADAIKEIRFREGSTDGAIKTCRVSLVENKPVAVLYETEAVTRIMPPQAQSYLLNQIGSGDWQSCCVIDRKVQHQTHRRVQGISGAEQKLKDILGLSLVETKKAWMKGQRPDGTLASEVVSCEAEKARAARAHITEQLPSLLNSLDGLHDRIGAVVISGGAVHDEAFIAQLKKEIPSNLVTITLKDLKISDGDGELDPSYACAMGIQSLGVSVAMDIGNSFLKGVFVDE
jgi:hypothetical protein